MPGSNNSNPIDSGWLERISASGRTWFVKDVGYIVQEEEELTELSGEEINGGSVAVANAKGELICHCFGIHLAEFNINEWESSHFATFPGKRTRLRRNRSGKLLIRPIDKAFWRYNGRFWELVQNDEEIRKLCVEETLRLGELPFTVNSISQQAFDLLKAMQALPGDPLRLMQPPSPVINCVNGELWINDDFTVDLRPHRPESYLRYGLDIDYDPSAGCPLFDEALLKVFQKSPDPEDMRRHLYEVFGYAIQPERDIKQFWMWEGAGDNGKTGVIRTLCKITGDAAIYSGDIRKIEHDYHRASLKAKLILLDDDVDWKTVLPDGILKQLSEGKLVLGRDPYGRPIQFTSCVLPILLCNKYPITKDLSHGVLSRAHVIPFRHRFVERLADGTPGDMDRGLFKQIWRTELPGILNRAIEGLKRLRERRGYLEPGDCITAKQEFLTRANPLPRFLASSACLRTLQALRESAANDFFLERQVAKNNPAELQRVEKAIAEAGAKAEAEGLKQPLSTFYTNFWQWCQNEGIANEKPRKADVENYLVNLGHPITIEGNQKWVDGIVSLNEGDQRPKPAM